VKIVMLELTAKKHCFFFISHFYICRL